MRISVILLGCLALGVLAEEKELVMVEVETGPGNKPVDKRSPQGEQYGRYTPGQYAAPGAQYTPAPAQYSDASGQYAAPGQYVLGPQPVPQIPGEYLSLLHELQGQQGVTSQQVHPNDIQQLLVSRTPQQFTTSVSQQPAPRPRLSPQAQEQRRLQEAVVQKNIREQEVRDSQRQQLREYYQQQGLAVPAAAAAAYQLQPQIQPHVQEQLRQQGQRVQYYQVPAEQQVQYYSPEPERVSYAQVQFGGGARSASVDEAPQQQQQLVYAPKPQRVVYQIPSSTTEAPKTLVETPSQAQAPQQYLIETTKPEDRVVSIPGPRLVYYRPRPDYSSLQESLLARQQEAQYAQEQREAPGVPSRSSIFVSKSSTPKPRVRVATPQGQRPLTETEVKALVDAGFRVGPESPAADYLSPYSVTPERTYYRGQAAKRQSKRVPRPVALSKEERAALASQGIRNLYRVETAESRDKPVTYVLALGKPDGQ